MKKNANPIEPPRLSRQHLEHTEINHTEKSFNLLVFSFRPPCLRVSYVQFSQ
jgi:hypothetical protein